MLLIRNVIGQQLSQNWNDIRDTWAVVHEKSRKFDKIIVAPD